MTSSSLMSLARTHAKMSVTDDAIEELLKFVRSINKYLEHSVPWKVLNEDKEHWETIERLDNDPGGFGTVYQTFKEATAKHKLIALGKIVVIGLLCCLLLVDTFLFDILFYHFSPHVFCLFCSTFVPACV